MGGQQELNAKPIGATNEIGESNPNDDTLQLAIEVETLAKSMKEFTIFRAPALRRSKKKYYEPRVVSIGPYHHGKQHLQAMEDLKQQCLKNLITAGNSNITEDYCLKQMEELEAQARRRYFESPGLRKGKQFAKMLLLDGCFILELMLEHHHNKGNTTSSMNHSIRNDLLMLENQIPFFVLESLFKIFVPSACESLGMDCEGSSSSLVKLAFEYLKPAIKKLKGDNQVPDDKLATDEVPKKVQHLLHLHYCFTMREMKLPEKAKEESRGTQGITAKASHFLKSSQNKKEGLTLSSEGHDTSPSSKCDVASTIGKCVTLVVLTSFAFVALILLPIIIVYFLVNFLVYILLLILFAILIACCNCCRPGWFELPESRNTIPSATELQDAGVTLRKRKSPKSLWDVHFDSKYGILQIPLVVVDESIKRLLINLVAFEQFAQEEVLNEITNSENTDEKADADGDGNNLGRLLACFVCITMSEVWQMLTTKKSNHDKPGKSWKKVTAYALFMDSIVNTDKDAMTLRQLGIIHNMLGSEEEVADFFNHLCEGVNHEENHYFTDKFDAVRKYCESDWRRHKAKLMHDYFSNPWSIISLVAAFLVLILTIAQTVISILQLVKG